tara:strand:- start:269 stop:469 length:201 start_codon:yes stop_codon:yes gene_type:complete
MTSAPVERTEHGNMAFIVPAVPTGMKAGVLISPLAVFILPKRALPSMASNENFIPISHEDIELEQL